MILRPVRRTTRPAALLVTLLAALALLLLLGASGAHARELPPPCADAPAPDFEDAGPYRTHSSAIGCIGAAGITDGMSATRYGYDEPLRQGQLATFLARGLDASRDHGVVLPQALDSWIGAGTPRDVAIDRLHEVGIIPDLEVVDVPARVTRGEMATLVAAALRFAGVLEGPTDEVVFTDLDGHPAADDVARLASAGVVHGDGEGRFRPDALLTRGQMATFVVNLLALIESGGATLPPPAPTPEPPPPPPPPPVRAPEGWIIAPGNGPLVGSGGRIARYTVEVADGLESRMSLEEFAERVETALSEPDRGWTARGRHRVQRVEDPGRANIRVVLASPDQVDRLCGRVGLNTGGIYSCWTGRFAALNADRWFTGVSHIPDLEVYRAYLINHEVGHGLGYGHVGCPGAGRPAPVMLQQSMSFRMGGCRPNGWPYP